MTARAAAFWVDLAEPRRRALIACQIQTGPGRTWTNRTYEVVRTADGQWLVDFGEGPFEPRRGPYHFSMVGDWNAVLDWLWRLSPRDIELLEEPWLIQTIQEI